MGSQNMGLKEHLAQVREAAWDPQAANAAGGATAPRRGVSSASVAPVASPSVVQHEMNAAVKLTQDEQQRLGQTTETGPETDNSAMVSGWMPNPMQPSDSEK